jgi:hypothetical protein
MALQSGFNITGLTLISSGSNYTPSTTFTLTARDKGQGSGFSGTCTSNSSGKIRSDNLTISSGGSNYSSGSWSFYPYGSAVRTTSGATTYAAATINLTTSPSADDFTNKKIGVFDSDDNFQVLTYTGVSGTTYTGVAGWKTFLGGSTSPSISSGTSLFNVVRSSDVPGEFTSISITGTTGGGRGCIIVPTIGFDNDISIDDIRTERGDGQGNNDIHDLYQAFSSETKANKKNFDWYEDGPESAGTVETHPIRFDEFFSAQYDAYGGAGCFSVDTPITLPDGSETKIEDLFIGQEVLAITLPTMPLDFDDEETWKDWETNTIEGAEQTTATVKEIYFDWYKDYYVINDRIKTTYEHPFFVKRDSKYTFETTADLQVGDEFLTDTSGSFLFETITSIEKIDEELETVNINCEPHDVYFAGGVLVHNVHEK